MVRAFSLSIDSDISRLPEVTDRIGKALGEAGFSSEEVLDTQLAVEEVITNVIIHGYKGACGEIRISCRAGGGSAEIEITDATPPFDPLSLPEPDLSGDIRSRKIGGLGVFLLRQVVDDVHYRRRGGKNILTLVKKKKP